MKKFMLLILAVVLALGTLGVGYAKWGDTVKLNAKVATDSVGVCFSTPFTSDPCGSGTVDFGGLGSTCNPLHYSKLAPSEQKDVACTSATVNPENCKELDVTVTNGYPYYRADVDWSICNTGSVPVKIRTVTISDDFGNSTTLVANGTVGLDLNNDGCCDMLINFGDNFGAQIGVPGSEDECADESFGFVLLECLPQNQLNTLHFHLTIGVEQWNEN